MVHGWCLKCISLSNFKLHISKSDSGIKGCDFKMTLNFLYIRAGGMVVVFESTMANCSAEKCINSLFKGMFSSF